MRISNRSGQGRAVIEGLNEGIKTFNEESALPGSRVADVGLYWKSSRGGRSALGAWRK